MKYIILFVALTFCLSCVQELRDITIHFQVDMSAFDNVQSVGVIGEWLPLTWDTPIGLSDLDKDGIYEGVITIQVAYNYSEFKFMLNEKEIELEGKGNRIVRFTDKTEVMYSGEYNISVTEESRYN